MQFHYFPVNFHNKVAFLFCLPCWCYRYWSSEMWCTVYILPDFINFVKTLYILYGVQTLSYVYVYTCSEINDCECRDSVTLQGITWNDVHLPPKGHTHIALRSHFWNDLKFQVDFPGQNWRWFEFHKSGWSRYRCANHCRSEAVPPSVVIKTISSRSAVSLSIISPQGCNFPVTPLTSLCPSTFVILIFKGTVQIIFCFPIPLA